LLSKRNGDSWGGLRGRLGGRPNGWTDFERKPVTENLGREREKLEINWGKYRGKKEEPKENQKHGKGAFPKNPLEFKINPQAVAKAARAWAP